MSKRTLFVIIAALALGGVLSACSTNELAEDLTPIPTLPPGQEPELVPALQGGAAEGGAESDPRVAEGQQLFAANCTGCHQAEDSATAPGLNLMAERAPERVEGMSAEEYLHQSIVDPAAHVVEGFQPIMPAFDTLSDEQVNSLVAYILSVGGAETGAAATAEPTVEAEATEAAATEEAATEAAATEEAGAAEIQPGDAAAGEAAFAANGCGGCHAGEGGAGPALEGMGARAEEHAAERDLSVVEYLHESIVDPGAYVVEGYQNIMPDQYGALGEETLSDLIAYLMEQ